MVVTSIMKQVKAKSLELMIIAFGFVAGGVWTQAIVEWMKPFMASKEGGAVPLTITAVIVTVVVVVMIVILTKLLGEKEEKK